MSGLCECGCGEKTAIAKQSDTKKGWVNGQPKRFVNGHNQRGVERSPEYRANIAAAKMGKSRPDMRGARSWRWSGLRPSYAAVHIWVNKFAKKTGVCLHCERVPTTRTEWANVSGEYRRDLNDFIELCVPCHRKFDAK